VNNPPEDITTAYSKALLEVGRAFPQVVVLDADIADSCKTEEFHTAFPERAFDLGVAEQSLPTFAAGLALMGMIPFYNSFAIFSVTRGVDMIRQSIAYNRANVKIIGHAAGQSMGYTGPSHHTIEDISILRAIPGITILSPCDAIETRQMVWQMAETEGPMYLRLVRAVVPNVHAEDYQFEFGKTELLRKGKDISIYVTGDVVVFALELHELLKKQGFEAQVVNVPTLKPLEPEEIIKYEGNTTGAITIEDHNIYGGLGSAISEIYARNVCKPVIRMGIEDTFTESDDRDVLRSSYGINLDRAFSNAREIINGSTRSNLM
jgi:transketolase